MKAQMTLANMVENVPYVFYDLVNVLFAFF